MTCMDAQPEAVPDGREVRGDRRDAYDHAGSAAVSGQPLRLGRKRELGGEPDQVVSGQLRRIQWRSAALQVIA